MEYSLAATGLDQGGVASQLHDVLSAELRTAGLPDMNDASIDGSLVRALKGGGHWTFAVD